MGRDEYPWDKNKSLPVPARFTERGEPPVVTLTGPRPPGGVEVTGGTVRIRFVDPAATVTTEVSDPPPPPGSKPVVTVRPRPDRAPEVEGDSRQGHRKDRGLGRNRQCPKLTPATPPHSATRSPHTHAPKAIEDGILVDVSDTACEAGFTIPVAVTRTVWTYGNDGTMVSYRAKTLK